MLPGLLPRVARLRRVLPVQGAILCGGQLLRVIVRLAVRAVLHRAARVDSRRVARVVLLRRAVRVDLVGLAVREALPVVAMSASAVPLFVVRKVPRPAMRRATSLHGHGMRSVASASLLCRVRVVSAVRLLRVEIVRLRLVKVENADRSRRAGMVSAVRSRRVRAGVRLATVLSLLVEIVRLHLVEIVLSHRVRVESVVRLRRAKAVTVRLHREAIVRLRLVVTARLHPAVIVLSHPVRVEIVAHLLRVRVESAGRLRPVAMVSAAHSRRAKAASVVLSHRVAIVRLRLAVTVPSRLVRVASVALLLPVGIVLSRRVAMANAARLRRARVVIASRLHHVEIVRLRPVATVPSHLVEIVLPSVTASRSLHAKAASAVRLCRAKALRDVRSSRRAQVEQSLADRALDVIASRVASASRVGSRRAVDRAMDRAVVALPSVARNRPNQTWTRGGFGRPLLFVGPRFPCGCCGTIEADEYAVKAGLGRRD